MQGARSLGKGRVSRAGAGGLMGEIKPFIFHGRRITARSPTSSFFRDKAAIMKKVRGTSTLYSELREELRGIELLSAQISSRVTSVSLRRTPGGLSYQYLDYFKPSRGITNLPSLAFLVGTSLYLRPDPRRQGLSQYKKNLVNRYESLADKQLSLCLEGPLGNGSGCEGYTMDLTWT